MAVAPVALMKECQPPLQFLFLLEKQVQGRGRAAPLRTAVSQEISLASPLLLMSVAVFHTLAHLLLQCILQLQTLQQEERVEQQEQQRRGEQRGTVTAAAAATGEVRVAA